MRKSLYLVIFSILFCGFSHNFGVEQLSAYQEQIVHDQTNLLWENIDDLFWDIDSLYWDILCEYSSATEPCCVLNNGSEGRYRDLSANINNFLLVDESEKSDLYSVKEGDVEIAKKMLIEECKFINTIIQATTDGSYILQDNMQKALQNFAKGISDILKEKTLKEKTDYENIKENINKRIDKILWIVSGDLGEEQDDDKVKKLRNKWGEISQINITSEIKKDCERQTNQIIHQINLFEKKDYANAGLHSEGLQIYKKKKLLLYAGILGGIIIATGVSFGIYYGVKKGKSGEEEDKAILLVDQ